MLDSSAMRDELAKDSAIYDRSFAAGVVNFSSPVFEIAVNNQFNDSADIVKVSNTKITLTGGFKYKIQAFLNCTCAFSNGYVDFQVYDASNTTQIGIKGTIVLATSGSNSGSVVQPVAYVNSISDVDIELQFAGGDDVASYYAAVVIQKI